MFIAITGKKGSGKDTFADALKERNFYVLKFADTLKNMIRTLYREAGLDDETIERKIEGDLKESSCEILGGSTPRWAMQSLGTEWAKLVDPTHTLWSRIFLEKAAGYLNSGTPVVCTDVRFQHEADVVKKLGGNLIRVDRPGQTNDDTHLSEQEMEKLQVDVTVGNIGSIRQLREKATKLIEELRSE